nr:hypothetical transcript [Hymenolepis microstoma]
MTGSNSGSDDSSESRKRHSDDQCEAGCSSKRPNCGVTNIVLNRLHEASTVHLKVLIPSIAAGAVIGKDGEAIERIQKESGAKVKMSKRNDFYPALAFATGRVKRVRAQGGGEEALSRFVQCGRGAAQRSGVFFFLLTRYRAYSVPILPSPSPQTALSPVSIAVVSSSLSLCFRSGLKSVFPNQIINLNVCKPDFLPVRRYPGTSMPYCWNVGSCDFDAYLRDGKDIRKTRYCNTADGGKGRF